MITVCVFALFGCSFHQQQNDLADNQYDEIEQYASSSAPYVGSWAIDSRKWRKIIKIRDNGKVKVVLSPGFGAIEGKVFLEGEKPFYILKDGTKAEIVKNEEGHLLIESYSCQERFASL